MESANLQAGDMVYFKRGSVWVGGILIDASGKEGCPSSIQKILRAISCQRKAPGISVLAEQGLLLEKKKNNLVRLLQRLLR